MCTYMKGYCAFFSGAFSTTFARGSVEAPRSAVHSGFYRPQNQSSDFLQTTVPRI